MLAALCVPPSKAVPKPTAKRLPVRAGNGQLNRLAALARTGNPGGNARADRANRLGLGQGDGIHRVHLDRLLVGAGLLGLAVALTTSGLLAGGSRSAAPGPLGTPAGRLVFSTRFPGHRLAGSDWNRFITSAAASGMPWNSNGRGGSAPANGRHLLDLEYDLPSQVRIDNGLRIVAERRPTSGMLLGRPTVYPWRSGAVSSYGKLELDGGFVQVEAKMPTGPGLWPGVFLLPGPEQAGRPDRHEIDLFEGGYMQGSSNPAENMAWRVHDGSASRGGVTGVGTDLSSGFHTYGIDWVPGRSVTWYFDGRQVGRVTSAQIAIPDEPMELIIDLQVANAAAGSFHTLVGPATPSSATMVVRGVQAYEPG